MKLLLIALTFAQLIIPVNLVQAQSSCQATVNSVIKEMKSKGAKRVKLIVNQDFFNEGEGIINPVGRDMISLLIPDTQKSRNILSSTNLLKNWSEQIFKDCKGTGYTYLFLENFDSFEGVIGLRTDGTLLWYRCENNPKSLKNPDSTPQYNAMEGSYCAWIPAP